MKIMCPNCKSRDIVGETSSSGKGSFSCHACGKDFNRIMPEKVVSPVKPPHVYQTPTPPINRSSVQVGRDWNSPISSLPMGSGPISMSEMEAMTSSGLWGTPQFNDAGQRYEMFSQEQMINDAGQMKFIPRR